jgi:hypothetical protein
MNHCEIVKDLLPLYIEDLTSSASHSFIDRHLTHCESCKKEYQQMIAPVLPQSDANEKWKDLLEKIHKEEQRKKRRKISLWLLMILLVLSIGGTHLKSYLDRNRTTHDVTKILAPERILELCPTAVPTAEELEFLSRGATLPFLTNKDKHISAEEFRPYNEDLIPSDGQIGSIDGWTQVLSIDYFVDDQRIILCYRDEDADGRFDVLEKYITLHYQEDQGSTHYIATYNSATVTTQYECKVISSE